MPNPVPLQIYTGPSIQSANFNNNGFANLTLPNKCKAGNTIVVVFQYGLGATGASGFQVTDDKGNAYVGVDGGHDAGNAQSCAAFYSVGVAADTQKLQLKNVTGGIVNFFQMSAFEVNDVTAIDVTNSANGTSAAPTGGSLAVTQAGDFIAMYVARTSSDQTTSWSAGNQAAASWRIRSAQLLEGNCIQAGIYDSKTAIAPSLTMGSSTTWVSVSLAFKTGNAGSKRPDGMYICGIHHVNYTGIFSSPLKIQVPAVGNLLVAMRSGGAGGEGTITGVTDSLGNTWRISSTVVNDGSDQYAYAPRLARADDLIISFAVTGVPQNHTYMMYDIDGADGEPFEIDGTATGNQLAAGDLATVTITPTAAGLLLSEMSNAFGTKNGVSNTDMTFDAFWWDGEPVDGPTNGDENNGWAHGYISDLAARTPTYTKTAGSGAAGQWESYAVVFKAAPVVPGQLLQAKSQSMT